MNDNYFPVLYMCQPYTSYEILSCPMCNKRITERTEFNGDDPITIQVRCPCIFQIDYEQDSGIVHHYSVEMIKNDRRQMMSCYGGSLLWNCQNTSFVDGKEIPHYMSLKFPVTKEKIQDIYKKLKRLSYYG